MGTPRVFYIFFLFLQSICFSIEPSENSQRDRLPREFWNLSPDKLSQAERKDHNIKQR